MMKKRDLLKKNLLFYKASHVRTVLGIAVSTAILVGSLIVGDSVRLSLRQMVSDRLGSVTHALESQDRFFTTELADGLAAELKTTVAPVLNSRGVVSISGGQQRANRVQILGVDHRFGKLGGAADLYRDLDDEEVIINSTLARQLDLKEGDEILLRIEKLDFIPRDIPLVSDDDLSLNKRYRIKHIAGSREFGQFSLRISQLVPNTVFMSLDRLAEEMGLPGRANMLLVSSGNENSVKENRLQKALDEQWSLRDAGLELRSLPGDDRTELRSSRIFLEKNVARAAGQLSQDAQPVITYFVNALKTEKRLTPYSFVSAPGSAVIPEDLKKDEIIINRWLAEDLGIGAGDSLLLTYYLPGESRTLVEDSTHFAVRSVVPLQGRYADSTLMPDFPGLAGEENCRDWDPGIPIDLDLIRPKDEAYWDAHGGTPKAFVTLQSAKEMWSNRFGEYTAIRFHAIPADSIRRELTAILEPLSFGYFFRPVREEGLQAAAQSVDFSQLFIGLSFFIIAGSLLLTVLLFLFNLEQRSRENGLYLALGFTQSDIRRLAFAEGFILALLGGILGSILAILYNQLIMKALRTVWQDIVGTTHIHMFIEWPTIVSGMLASVIIVLIVIYLVIRKQGRIHINELRTGVSKLARLKPPKRKWLSALSAGLLLTVVLIILISTPPGKSREAAGAFFLSGFLILSGGLLLSNYFINLSRSERSSLIPKISYLALSNTGRNKIRSLTLAGMLASGLFIVFTVGANQQGLQQDPERRSSGTGGFTIFAESLFPVLRDLNTEAGQEFYGLKKEIMNDVSIVPFRLREGDDASCLNLNRVATPRLLGVSPQTLARRNAFSFVSRAEGAVDDSTWLTLNQDIGEGIIPGIADETVIIWGLGKSVGDTLLYFDENGQPFRIKLMAGLANSVFQGNLLISEENFTRLYPSVSGYRLFLIDTPPDKTGPVSEELTWALRDLGFETVSTARRLAGFNKVQNTYLSIFLILGGFGLILGTIGIAVVVLRNVNDRKNELALLLSVGYSRKTIKKIILLEHGILVSAGILLGLLAAIFAALPALTAPGSGVPLLLTGITLLVVTVNASLWTYAATASATSGDLIPALRNE